MNNSAVHVVTPGRNAPKRVVIVDDSRSIRLWLRHLLDSDVRIEVVGEAEDAQTAREVIKRTRPDVVTLDIEMPGMSGLEFLERLMRLYPLPVVMVSSTTRSGSDAAVKALSLGAVDCVVKPQMDDVSGAQRNLVRRVFSAACSQVPLRPQKVKPRHPQSTFGDTLPRSIILIGASTGGVGALEAVLPALHPDGPPVVVVQHMPGQFLHSFTEMLNRKLPQDVALFRQGEQVSAGQIRFAPSDGTTQTEIVRVADQWTCRIVPSDSSALHSPSVDSLFHSAHKYARDVIAVQLTGLGKDGATGMKILRDAGARTIGQDSASSVVYGMPRAAFEMGAVETQLPLDMIGDAVNHLAETHHISTKAGR